MKLFLVEFAVQAQDAKEAMNIAERILVGGDCNITELPEETKPGEPLPPRTVPRTVPFPTFDEWKA